MSYKPYIYIEDRETPLKFKDKLKRPINGDFFAILVGTHFEQKIS